MVAVKGKLNDKKLFKDTGIKRPAKALVRSPGNSRDKAVVRVMLQSQMPNYLHNPGCVPSSADAGAGCGQTQQSYGMLPR